MHSQECALSKNVTCDTLLKRLGLHLLISGKTKVFSLPGRMVPQSWDNIHYTPLTIYLQRATTAITSTQNLSIKIAQKNITMNSRLTC